MKLQYSKLLAIVSVCIYIITLGYVFYNPNLDSTIGMSSLTASGSIALTTIVFYMKNSWVEKTARIKLDIVKETSNSRLNYNKEMLSFMKENGFNKTELDEIEIDSVADDLDNSAIDSLTSSVDSTLEDASSSPEPYSL